MTAGWLAQTCPAFSTRAERAPHGPCPSEACPGTDAAPSLQTGELTWLWVALFGHSLRRPQGPDPRGTGEGYTVHCFPVLLENPARENSKLEDTSCPAGILFTADTLGVTVTLLTSGQPSSAYSTLHCGPKGSPGPRALAVPPPDAGLPSTRNTLGRELYASDPSQLCLGLSSHSWWSMWWHSVHPTYLCSFLSYSSEKKSGKHKGTIHCPSMYSQVSAWCLAHRACLINAS